MRAVNDQVVKLVDELNKVNSAREQLIQQIQNLNGVAMYLRGKLQPDEGVNTPIFQPEVVEESADDLERSSEYPEEETSD